MNLQFLGTRDVVTGDEIFRISSLLLYVTLLLDVAVTWYDQRLNLSDTSSAVLLLLGLLFMIALLRYLVPRWIACNSGRAVAELLGAVLIIVVLTVQRAMPTPPLPWLIALAGVFPIAIEGGIAFGSVLLIAGIGLGLTVDMGVQLSDWLPNTFAILFVGLLAALLSQALSINVSAVRHARNNDRRFDAIARTTRHVFLIADAGYRLKFSNPALTEIIGYSQEELSAEGAKLRVHPEDKGEHEKKLRHLRDTSRSSIFSRHRIQHKDGQWIWMETSGYNMLHDPAINGLVFSLEDISARKDAELKLEQEHSLLRAVLDLNPSLIYAKDTLGCFTISNLSFQRRFGYVSEDELRGKTSYDLFLADAAAGKELEAYKIADALHTEDMRVIESGIAQEDLEIQGFIENDSESWYRTNKYPLRNSAGKITGILGITRDITESKKYEMRLEHQALHDPLTQLPNRRYVLRKIGNAIFQPSDDGNNLVILFCDLDFFKSVNDTHGHDFGDKCLMALTERILAQLPPQDFVARFGGNEFIVLTYSSLPEAQKKAELLLHAISQQLMVDNAIVKIQTSIGIAQLNPEHKTPSELIRDADAAMYQAKERGRNRAEIFDASLQNTNIKRAQMDVALRFALERKELALVYQPKVSLIGGAIKGFELLLRWNSPEYGLISPTEFIPIAETSGMVIPIGLWVLEEACKQLAQWQSQYPEASQLTIGVNVSMRQLLQSSFLTEVTRIVKDTGVMPHTLELEITETSAMANPLQTIENLSMLKKLGLRLALDDFGTGYSSLSYLQKLPIDVLKIDQTFIRGLGKNHGDTEIVRLILALAQTLNLETIAEGVETIEHIDELKRLGCFVGQGYLFSAPVTANEAEMLITDAVEFSVSDEGLQTIIA